MRLLQLENKINPVPPEFAEWAKQVELAKLQDAAADPNAVYEWPQPTETEAPASTVDVPTREAVSERVESVA